MCGLVGVFGNINPKMEKVFEDLLQIDVIRGSDSTGVAVVHEGNNASPAILKDTYLPGELLEEKKYKKVTRVQNILMMGHNRAATMGWITRDNAHPFRNKHITLAHNGTLSSVRNIPNSNNYDTDSEAICSCIAEIGIEETWTLLNGAATLTYWDENKKTFNIISNKKRPFYFCYTEKENSLVWASEEWMLSAALDRRDVKAEKERWSPNEDMLLQFAWNSKEHKVDMTHEKLEPYVHVGGQYNSYNEYGGYYTYNQNMSDEDEWIRTWQKDELKKKEKAEKEAEKISNIVPFQPENLAKSNNLTIAQFRQKYDTCIFCENSLFSEYDDAYIIDSHSAVCGSCKVVADMNNIDIKKEMEL